ncbi:MAG: hypothetical protein NCW75_13485 [Phycisphaera sp.]|nr:MAG: hypothetical protein NCW75_13485 [Phycisphaera sp.]
MDESSPQPPESPSPSDLSSREGAQKSSSAQVEAAEALENAPPFVRESMMALMASGPLPNPVANQVRPEHIKQSLDLADKQSDRDDRQESRSKLFLLIAFVIVVGLVVFLVIFLKDDPDLLQKVLTYAGTLFAGVAAGFGIGRAANQA